MKTKQLFLGFSDFKALDDGSMEFTCYGNVKGNIDHARDMTMPGAYTKSIHNHKTNGTMPLMLWGHDSRQPPVGAWIDMKEDDHGLWMKGQFADTPRGHELYKLAKMGAVNAFSIGYIEVNSKWNTAGGYNELHEVDIKETSIVNFACNEASVLTGIKSKLEEGDLPTPRELQALLRDFAGLSKRQAERIANKYEPTEEVDFLEGLFNN